MSARPRDVEAILRARAKALAAPDPTARIVVTEALVVFGIGGNTLAVPLAKVTRAARLNHLTEIPHAPPYLLGVTAVEGQLVSLLDLAAFLGLGRAGWKDIGAAVVVAHGGREIGLGADDLHGIEDVPARDVARLPGARGPLTRMARLDGESVLVLDVEAVLSDPRLQAVRG